MQVLVIDDSLTNLTLIRHLLAKLPGCTPLLFEAPDEALGWCRANTPDLAIIDFMMPEMNGVDFIRRFRQLDGKADIPVLMITSNTAMNVRLGALESGANDFLTKPINKTEFTLRVKNMLALRHGQKMLSDRAGLLADEVRRATAGLLVREHETIVRLSRLAEYRDQETGGHIQRMAFYSRHIARNLGLAEEEQELIVVAAPMHDIGKVGVPDHILLKPGKLDAQEFALMKKHPEIGHDVLKDSSAKGLQAAAIIALSHHEKFDGTGYPSGLKGEAIPLYGRIVAVADVFDALTSVRPYKQAFDIPTAVDIIKQSTGSHFDPSCVRAFFQDWEHVLDIRNSLTHNVDAATGANMCSVSHRLGGPPRRSEKIAAEVFTSGE